MTKDNSVQSIERALDIIEALADYHDGLGVTEIATRIGLNKSTVHRILSTLMARGYVSKTDKGTYRLGINLIEVVSCYINNLELQTEARPYVAQTTAELGLTSHLGVLDGNQVVYIEKWTYSPMSECTLKSESAFMPTPVHWENVCCQITLLLR